eukprot:g7731.t1
MEEDQDPATSSPTVTAEDVVQLTKSLDFAWIFVCMVLVVLMQSGFAAYEVGTIRSTTSSSILKKNMGDASVSLIAWVICGYAIASGEDKGRAAGGSYFFLRVSGKPFEATEDRDSASLFLEFVFQWSFAATCTTIVSGAVADRVYVRAYFVYAFLTSALFYPLLAHAVWADEGWASPLRTSGGEPDAFLKCGVVDFAGSGIVHMLGGGISFVMAMRVNNRPGRFVDADAERVQLKREEQGAATTPAGATFSPPILRFFKLVKPPTVAAPDRITNLTSVRQLNEFEFRPNDPSWMTLGCFLLWLGWYGFNRGSTLQISTEEKRTTAGRAALNTTIGAAVGCVSSMLVECLYHCCFSPEYRQRDYIDDPLQLLHGLPKDNDAYEKHHKRGSSWKWPLATHKDIHAAGCNGVLAGLVGITAGCATMDPWPAIGVSIGSGLLYHFWYRAIVCCRVDDAVNAAAIHLFGGLWGLVAAGFTVTNGAREDLGYPKEEDGCFKETQAEANAAMAAIIFGYSLACGAMLCAIFALPCLKKVRHDNQVERRMDPDVRILKNKLEEYIVTTDAKLAKLNA